jgi:hypothetical protein
MLTSDICEVRKLVSVSEQLNRVIESKGFINHIQKFLEAPSNAEDLMTYAGEVDSVLREYEVIELLLMSQFLVFINYAAISTAGYIRPEPRAKRAASGLASIR